MKIYLLKTVPEIVSNRLSISQENLSLNVFYTLTYAEISACEITITLYLQETHHASLCETGLIDSDSFYITEGIYPSSSKLAPEL